MPYFLCRLVSPRPSFPHDMTAAEAALMQEHASYWMGLVQDGTAVAFGPVFDAKGAWGLGLVEVHGESAANALTAADPVVRQRRLRLRDLADAAARPAAGARTAIMIDHHVRGTPDRAH